MVLFRPYSSLNSILNPQKKGEIRRKLDKIKGKMRTEPVFCEKVPGFRGPGKCVRRPARGFDFPKPYPGLFRL